MEKRKMLSFDISVQIFIETAASLFLLVASAKLFCGLWDPGQGKESIFILVFFASVFAVGGILGLVKTAKKYKNHVQKGVK